MPEANELSYDILKLDSGSIIIKSETLIPHARRALDHFLRPLFPEINWEAEKITIPRFVMMGKKVQDLMPFIRRILCENSVVSANKKDRQALDPEVVISEGRRLAERIQSKKLELIDILTQYETHRVAEDEINRSLDLLNHLDENIDYFVEQVGPCTAFLPKNQPLYAFCCFVVVPALMSKEVNTRVPSSMKEFFGKMIEILEIKEQFRNINIYENTPREKFIKERAPKTEVVIFTGTQKNGENLRTAFPKETLFILNGAGHNPLVITETANVRDAVAAAISVGFYNQGQDCAAPNSFLVHRKVYHEFLRQLIDGIRQIKVGSYKDADVEVGPVTDVQELVRLQAHMVREQRFLHCDTLGIIRTRDGIMEPTVIDKPLEYGGNYQEPFAPLVYVQPYEQDVDLAQYFEAERYGKNAMYIAVYGQSDYIDRKLNEGWPLHSRKTVLHNTHLHAPGVERGTQEYGGYGAGASNISICNNVLVQPTLPQRDIYRFLVEPGILKQQQREKFYLAEHYREMLQNYVSTVQTNRLDPHKLERRDWASYAADQVIDRFPDQEIYTCSSGISPSGVVHFGNFRDAMISVAVAKELKSKGKNVRLLFSWDDYDRFRKVPAGVPSSFEQYIGLPLNQVPDPQGEYKSFAERYEKEFEKTLTELGIEMELVHQGDRYPSGQYKQDVIEAMQKKDLIAEILYSFMSEKSRSSDDGERGDFETFKKNFWPITIYSPFTGKDNVTILSFDGDSIIHYRCNDTGNEGDLDLKIDFNVKLGWKVDWPMRWRKERVTFEPGGKDHATVGGSYDVSALIAKRVFNQEPPVFVGYDFVGIQGLEGKMSSSAGNALSPGKLLEIYTPGLLLNIYGKASPPQSFNLSFGTEIYRQYDEMDRGNIAKDPETKPPLTFRQAVAVGQTVQWDLNKMKIILGTEYDEASIDERIPRARTWLEQYNPKEIIKLLDEPNHRYFSQMKQGRRAMIEALVDYLKTGDCEDLNQIKARIYEIPKKETMAESEHGKAQKDFFNDVYQLLLGKEKGPRLAIYIWASRHEEIIRLLDFRQSK